jgi:hypothetical protein
LHSAIDSLQSAAVRSNGDIVVEKIRNPFLAPYYESGSAEYDPRFSILLSPQFAQCAEDLIVVALVKSYCARHDLDTGEQTYCEIGAYHAVVTSSTYLLNQSLGMRGVLVDANEQMIPALRADRPQDTVVYAAITDCEQDKAIFTVSQSAGLSSLDETFAAVWKDIGTVGRVEVPAMHINTLFGKYFAEKAPVYLAIDAEGMDFRLLQALNWDINRPYIVQTEQCEGIVPGSTKKTISFMHGAGYVLMAQTEANLIFVDERKLFESRE